MLELLEAILLPHTFPFACTAVTCQHSCTVAEPCQADDLASKFYIHMPTLIFIKLIFLASQGDDFR